MRELLMIIGVIAAAVLCGVALGMVYKDDE